MFYKISSSVGSGKTQAVLEHIRDNLGVGYLYVCPTRSLCDEVYARLLQLLAGNPEYSNNGPLRKVVSENQIEEAVYPRAMAACEAFDQNLPPIVIVTTTTFEYLLRHLSNHAKGRFQVFIDEGLPAIRQVQFSPGDPETFLKYLEHGGDGFVSPAKGQTEILEWCAHSPKKLAGHQLDQLAAEGFREICKLVVSGIYETYLVNTGRSFEALGVLSPDALRPFISVTLVVAIFERTLLPIVWRQRHQVEFEDFPLKEPLFDAHEHKGPQLSIWHALHEGDHPSTRNLTRNFDTGEPNEKDGQKQVIYRAAQHVDTHFNEVANRAYCWSANRYFKNPDDVLGGTKMPPVCAGLDTFKNFNYLATFLCMNPAPWVKKRMLELFELEDDHLYELWRFEHTYQNVGRCSLRIRERNDPIEVVVTSKRCAEQLNELFPGSKILGQLGDLPRYSTGKKSTVGSGGQPISYTTADNTAYSKYRKRLEDKLQKPLEKTEWFETIRLNTLKSQG